MTRRPNLRKQPVSAKRQAKFLLQTLEDRVLLAAGTELSFLTQPMSESSGIVMEPVVVEVLDETGQRDTASKPLEQCDVEMLFEQPDLLADGGGCQAQFARGGREAAVTRRRLERPQPSHVREVCHDSTFNENSTSGTKPIVCIFSSPMTPSRDYVAVVHGGCHRD